MNSNLISDLVADDTINVKSIQRNMNTDSDPFHVLEALHISSTESWRIVVKMIQKLCTSNLDINVNIKPIEQDHKDINDLIHELILLNQRINSSILTIVTTRHMIFELANNATMTHVSIENPSKYPGFHKALYHYRQLVVEQLNLLATHDPKIQETLSELMNINNVINRLANQIDFINRFRRIIDEFNDASDLENPENSTNHMLPILAHSKMLADIMYLNESFKHAIHSKNKVLNSLNECINHDSSIVTNLRSIIDRKHELLSILADIDAE